MPHDKLLILVALVVAALLFLGLWLWLRQRQQEEAQKTVRLSIERGVQLTPEVIRGLGIQPPASDLRRGAIDLCIAVGILLWGILDHIEDGEKSSLLTFLALAAFPALIGAVLIVFHFVDRRRRPH